MCRDLRLERQAEMNHPASGFFFSFLIEKTIGTPKIGSAITLLKFFVIKYPKTIEHDFHLFT